MGPTGTGKSSFIRLITGDKNVAVGHSVESMTSTIGRFNYFTEGGRCVTFVDTPGFDDSREGVTDTDILREIASFLDVEFKRGKNLNGIIYLHRITDPRMGGALNRNLKMFQKLCGVDALKNVIVVTTRWDDVQEKDREATERREEELMKTKGMFFEPIIAAGGRFLRHDNTIESARRTMDQLVDKEPIPLQIQIEMRDGKKVEETTAGIELRAEMNKLIEKHANEMKNLIEEMEEAIAEKDEELRKELEAEQTRLQKDIEKWEAEKKRLAGDLDSVTQATVVTREEAERQIGQQRNEYLRKIQEQEKKQKGPMHRDNTGHRLEKPEYSENTVDQNNPALEAER
ncbi:P-loop containing nucleoside triphosphate hydrolase protein [Amanita rubescens]|nr:P-loop containing nucleoside triphosphate hydrolase protein [Amanita rubescens]